MRRTREIGIDRERAAPPEGLTHRLSILEAYTDIVVEEVAERSRVVLVAQSMGAFTAAMVCARVPVEKLIFLPEARGARATPCAR
jgi:hypothetical protein